MNTTIRILEQFVFEHDSVVSALSGVACVGEDLYFVGDDVRYLLKTNRNNKMVSATVFEKVPLSEPSEQIPLVALSKAKKPDFEALSCISLDGQQQLLVMGSGSTENRKQALLYNPFNNQISIFLDAIDYHFLEDSVELTGGAELNIEAVCSDHRHLYIFQRGNINRHHGVLVFDLVKIQAGEPLESALINSLNLNLPEIEGAASGISDAYFFVDKNLIVATAAVEQTLNTYDDGDVLGSFILVFTPDGNALSSHLIQDVEGKTLPIKVEGITWLESRPDGEVFLLVTDSDGGDSEILKVLLNSSAFAKSGD
ncbi:hypothetical protein NDN11_15020 [Acinetobacter sp. C26M]|uniref:DUF6929 family protein n=1 Tax=unclassified Acinetobacter TaxID=196816 RepID=UPI002037065F|nr:MULTISPECIES: hypothetical protein [unclassified Acinetobacter]USA48349.1 hypothetical protein NDN11_15020 [Acinetobacter sp. C26M]USA51837.1 hypothetical protein NDN12_14935 [Acinetobacter sp. C26G]